MPLWVSSWTRSSLASHFFFEVHGDMRPRVTVPRRSVYQPPGAARRWLQPTAEVTHQGRVYYRHPLLQTKR